MSTINTWNNTVPSAVTTFNSGLTISTAGIMNNSKQPAFFAYCNTDPGAITSLITVPIDTKVFDQTSSFNTGTNTFTAPISGVYRFGYFISYSNTAVAGGADPLFVNYFINAASIQYNVILNGEYTQGEAIPYRSDAVFATGGTVTVQLSATNTVFCQFNIDSSGGDQADGLITGATNTYFWGCLIA